MMKGRGKPLQWRQQDGETAMDSSRRRFFCFSWVLYSLAFTTKTKLSALTSSLISSLIHRTRENSTILRFCDFSASRRKIAENVPKRWRVKSFLRFLLFIPLVFLKKRLFDGDSVDSGEQTTKQRHVLQQFYLYHTALCYYVDTILLWRLWKMPMGKRKRR
jgi:hypothetical protein